MRLGRGDRKEERERTIGEVRGEGEGGMRWDTIVGRRDEARRGDGRRAEGARGVEREGSGK